MAIAVIPSNSDQVLRLRIKGADGNYIDATEVEIHAAVYQRKENVLQKWVDADIERVSPQGTVQFYLDRANIKNVPEKRLFLELIIIKTDANFKNGEQRLVATNIPLADIVLSVL